MRTQVIVIQRTMKLKVKSLDESSYEFEMDPNDTVSMLKRKVADLYGVFSSEITLIYSGRILSNGESSLTSVGLRDESTLHVIKKVLRPTAVSSGDQSSSQHTNTTSTDTDTNENGRVFNIELHTAVATVSNLPDSILQYINEINPLRAQYQQQGRELRRRFPSTIPQMNDDMEFIFAKLRCAIGDWNQFYPSYNFYVESDGLLPTSGDPAPSTSSVAPFFNTGNHSDMYFTDYINHLSSTLNKLDNLREVIRTTLIKFERISETLVNSNNVEDMQFRITSATQRCSRLMAIFSVILQQLSSVKFSYDNTTEPFTIRSSPHPVSNYLDETNLQQVLGTNSFSVNTPSTNPTSGIAVPIFASMENMNAPRNPTSRQNAPSSTNSTSATNNNESNNTSGRRNSERRNVDYRSIFSDIIQPIVDSLSNATASNITAGNVSQSTSNRASRSIASSLRNSQIPSHTIPNYNIENAELLQTIQSLSEPFRTTLEHDFRKVCNIPSNSLALRRSFNYLRDVSDDSKTIESINNAKQYLNQPFCDIVQNSFVYEHYLSSSNEPFRTEMFNDLVSSEEFEKTYRRFLKCELVKLRSKYHNEDL